LTAVQKAISVKQRHVSARIS